jgi:hypothetical protein
LQGLRSKISPDWHSPDAMPGIQRGAVVDAISFFSCFLFLLPRICHASRARHFVAEPTRRMEKKE